MLVFSTFFSNENLAASFDEAANRALLNGVLPIQVIELVDTLYGVSFGANPRQFQKVAGEILTSEKTPKGLKVGDARTIARIAHAIWRGLEKGQAKVATCPTLPDWADPVALEAASVARKAKAQATKAAKAQATKAAGAQATKAAGAQANPVDNAISVIAKAAKDGSLAPSQLAKLETILTSLTSKV